MQVFCANCQLSFEAPEGASGLQCPICRSPLTAAGTDTADAKDTGRHGLSAPQDWSGGTLDELVAALSAPALSARVEVLGADGTVAGEVYVIAGGVSDALIKGQSLHDALDKLRAVKASKFRVEQRLPNPADGDLASPGPASGKLEERSLPILMRYCEDFVLTASIEVWRGSENAKVEYRRGEIVGVTVGGIDAPERLAEVMQWAQGQYRLSMPPLSLPAPQPKQVEAPVPQAQVTGRPASAGKTIFGMPALDIAAMAAAAQKQVEQARARVSADSAAVPAAAAAPAAAPAATSAPAATPAAAAPARKGAAAAKTIVGVAVPQPVPEAPAATKPADTAKPAATAKAAETVKPAEAAAKTATDAKAESKREKTSFAEKKAAKREAERNDVARKMTAEAEKPAPGARATSRSEPAATTALATTRDEKKQPARTRTTEVTTKETSVWTYVGVGFIFGLALLGVYRVVLSLLH